MARSRRVTAFQIDMHQPVSGQSSGVGPNCSGTVIPNASCIVIPNTERNLHLADVRPVDDFPEPEFRHDNQGVRNG